jgi:hypothetical protein
VGIDTCVFPAYTSNTRKKERKKMSFPIIENAKRQAFLCFKGIAIPCDKKTVDGEMIRSEKVLKFNRKAMRELSKCTLEKVDPRLVGGEDRMRFKVGKPGSAERVATLAAQYASLSEDEMSPFYEWGTNETRTT